MAVEPLFVKDMEELTLSLRMDQAYHDNVLAVLDDAVSSARLRMYDHLGVDRINELIAYGHSVDNPSSEDDLLRKKADIVEIKLCRIECIKVFPLAFSVSHTSAHEEWNSAEFSREFGSQRFKTEQSRDDRAITRLERECIELLDELRTKTMDDSIVDVSVIGAEEPTLIGQSIYSNKRIW